MDDDLFNIVMAALAKPRKGIWNYQSHKTSELSRRDVQRSMVGSQKFVISDSLLEHCVLASLAKPKSLLEMCELSIPAFNNMWIEWDEKKRMDLFRHHSTKMGLVPDDFEWTENLWSKRVGYHIWGDTGVTHSHYSQFHMDESGQIAVPPMAIALDNEKPIDSKSNVQEISGKDGYEIRHLREQQKELGVSLVGTFYAKAHEGSRYLERLYYQMLPSLHNAGNMVLPKKIQDEDKIEHARTTCKACAGDMRFLIAAMAMLNYPHTVKERKTEKGLPRIAFGRSVPRNELRIVELDLPKPNGVTRYERMFKGGGGKKRRHVRRGHWHTFIYKNGERRRKWVEEKWVGDASLGTITHDYHLKSKGSK